MEQDNAWVPEQPASGDHVGAGAAGAGADLGEVVGERDQGGERRLGLLIVARRVGLEALEVGVEILLPALTALRPPHADGSRAGRCVS